MKGFKDINLKNHISDGKLSLFKIKFDSKDIAELFNYLNKNPQINSLVLTDGCINDLNINEFAKRLKENKTLTTLGIGGNDIGNIGAEHIASALKENKTLTTLGIGSNDIGNKGAKHIANALKVNKTLTTLNILNNNISTIGAEYIASVLKENKTLTALYIDDNNISQLGFRHTANSLKENKNLLIYNRSFTINYDIVNNIADKLIELRNKDIDTTVNITSREYREFLDREDGNGLRQILKEKLTKSGEEIKDVDKYIEDLYSNARNAFNRNAIRNLAIARGYNSLAESQLSTLPNEVLVNIMGFAYSTSDDLKAPFVKEKEEKKASFAEAVKSSSIPKER